jgi:hypothetical protein
MTNTDVSLRTYFQDKIKSKEPSLFLTTKTPGKTQADSYSRVCQSSQKRQPVILTKTEYAGIADKYPEFKANDKHIVYGTGPTKYYYICPQYWDTRTNMPITDEEMKEKNLYDHVISDTQKKITEQKYIYHLNDHGKINAYPNFIFKNGQCAPCCFAKNNTPKAIAQRAKCNQKPDAENSSNTIPIQKTLNKTRKIHSVDIPLPQPADIPIQQPADIPIPHPADIPLPQPLQPNSIVSTFMSVVKNKPEKKEKETNKGASEYIKNADKFPLEPNRLGYIPVSLQKLFVEDISRCAFIHSHKGIENDYYCILRSGITLNPNQSFLECIADMYSISIESLKFKISKYLTIDNFIKLQNGNLVTAFYDPDLDTTLFMDLYDEIIETSNLYKILVLDEDYHDSVVLYNHIYFDKVFIAYVNFMHNYLFKTTTFIDHTYMWDIILQIYDINLCIFDIKSGQSGDIVNVLCPTNKYSVQLLNPKINYDIGFIIKKNEYYEPVYIIKTHLKICKKIKLFNIKHQYVGYTVNMLLKILLTIRNKCSIKDTPNLSIVELFRTISSKDYVITHKIMNYSTQIIGLRVGDETFTYGVIPCIPTTFIESDYTLSSIPTKLTTSQTLWSTLKNTIQFYEHLDTSFRDSYIFDRLPKLAYVLLNTKKQIEGFITNYHQLIEVTDRIAYNPKIHSKYTPYKGKFMTYTEEQKISMTAVTNTVDKELLADIDNTDTKRIQVSSDIDLETLQYALFRNIIKTWIRRSDEWKSWIIQTTNEAMTHVKNGTLTPDIIHNLYDTMITILESVTNDDNGNSITFLDNTPEGFLELLTSIDINTVQKVSLVNNNNNKTNYFIKLSEELLFNNRLRRYILDDNTISLYKKNYEVASNEILLSDTSINEYYDKVIYNPIPKFPTNAYYDEVNPDNIPQKDIEQFDNTLSTSEMIESVCETPVFSKVSPTSYIKRICIPSIQKNILFQSFSCVYSITHTMVSDLIRFLPEFLGRLNKPHGEIRNDLIALYNEYFGNTQLMTTVYNVLALEGKGSQIKYLQNSHELSISNLINMPTYTLTLLDYFVICTGYNIPAFIIHEKLPMSKRFNANDRITWLCNKDIYKNIPDKFFCIVITWSPDREDKPIYTLLSKSTYKDDRIFTMNDFDPIIKNMLQDTFINGPNIHTYLNKFIDTPITIHNK